MAVPLTKEFVAAVRNAGDIVRLVSDYVPLKPAGSRLKGLCPFHHEKTPSFSVDPQMQLFYCFGCQAGGDAFKFVMLYEKTDFPESVEFLAKRWGVPLPKSPARPEDESPLAAPPDERVGDGFLPRPVVADPTRGRVARDYIQARGVSDIVAERFALGYAPDAWDALLGRPRSPRFHTTRNSVGRARDPEERRIGPLRPVSQPRDLPDPGGLGTGSCVRRPQLWEIPSRNTSTLPRPLRM